MSHLPVAITTNDAVTTQTTSGNMITLMYLSGYNFYLRCALVVMGVAGTAGNAFVIYALVASKQHKKHPLIVNQNALDFACSFFLVVCKVVELCNIRFTGSLGYWLCMLIHSETLIAYTMYGSRINIAAITVERYLKVVHSVWSKKRLRSWMIRSTMAFCWLVGTVQVSWNAATRSVRNGVCYAVISTELLMGAMWWYIITFYGVVFAIFNFCYGRILMTIRRQAHVMAAYSTAGPSTAPRTQQIQTNVIKTMILVSAFYVICHLLQAVQYIAYVCANTELVKNAYITDAARIVQFFYITTNPFIYAIKFDPVKKVLKDLILRCMPSKLAQSQASATE